MNTLRFSSMDGYDEVILIDKIIRLSKDIYGQITFIHLSNGEVIRTRDSLDTLDARIKESIGVNHG